MFSSLEFLKNLIYFFCEIKINIPLVISQPTLKAPTPSLGMPHLSHSISRIVGTNFTRNYSLPIKKTIQIIFSKVLTTFTIWSFTQSKSSINCIHFILLQLSFSYFPNSLLSSIIKIYDQIHNSVRKTK